MMPVESTANMRSRDFDWIGRVRALAVFAIAPVAVIAPKGLPILMAISAIAALQKFDRSPVIRRLGVLFAPLLLWVLVSTSWSPDPANAMVGWVQLSLGVACGLVILSAAGRLDGAEIDRLGRALVAGLVVAGLATAILAAYAQGLLPGLVPSGKYVNLFVTNRGLAIAAMLAWPAAWWLWRRGRRVAAALLVALLFAMTTRLVSLAAVVAMLAGLLALAFVLALPRLAPRILAATMVLTTLGLPWAMRLLPSPDALIQAAPWMKPSSMHRLYIWQFVTERIAERPWLGWGFDASRAIPGGTARPPIGSEMLPLHPHNSILQSWLELGLPGALGAAMLLGWVFLAARGPSRGDAASRAAVAAAFCAVSFTAYGMWQNWWLAGTWLTLGITATLTGAAAQRESQGEMRDGVTARG